MSNNEDLRKELNKYKSENDQLKNRINQLNIENENLKAELKAVKDSISSFKNTQLNSQESNEIISSLNEIIESQDKEINDLKNKLKNNTISDIQKPLKKSYELDEIIVVHFISMDQKINCALKCLKTDTFAEVEEKLYQKYEEFRETNNNFITKGKVILRFKKISENNIQDGDKIELINIE